MTLEIWPWPVNTKVALITAARSKPVLGKEKKSNQYLDFMMIFWIHLKIIFGCVFIIMWLRRFSIFYVFFAMHFIILFFLWSPKSKYLICGSEDHFVYIWKTQHEFYKFSSARRDRNDYWEAIKGRELFSLQIRV